MRPRIGQGGFRFGVLDTYRRRCAVTGEKALPVLDAAHIRGVKEGGQHRLDNGLLLRSDVHRLFDAGCVRVTLRGCCYFEVPRLRFAPLGTTKEEGRPNREFLEWHGGVRFRG